MRQVLFSIPLSWLNEGWSDIPIYGYGMMLFCAFIFCSMLAKRLCKREGIDGNLIPDLIIWLFVAGIAGGRIVFVLQYWQEAGFAERPFWHVLALWDGGLVLYGALIGGATGYFSYSHFVLRKHNVSNWKMLDVIAPSVAVGIALGRIGCLFTGCCYGNVACAQCPSIHFPLLSNTAPPVLTAPAKKMVQLGYQSPLGFQWKENSWEVEAVEPGTAAARAGLRNADVIVDARLLLAGHETPILKQAELGRTPGQIKLTVRRDGENITLEPFEPQTIGLHPTQIYETISMCLLLFFLLSYYPYKRHDGELMVLFMLGYGVHRFLNEMLRTDTDPVAFGLTLSQNGSLIVVAGAAILAYAVWRRPMIAAVPLPSPLAGEG